MIYIACYLAPNVYVLSGPKEEIEKVEKAIKEYIKNEKLESAKGNCREIQTT